MKRKIVLGFMSVLLASSLLACSGNTEVSKDNEAVISDENEKQSDKNIVEDKSNNENNDDNENEKKDNRLSQDMYMDFISGNEKVYTDNIDYTYYSYEDDTFKPYFDESDGMTLSDMMKRIVKIENNDGDVLLNAISYSLIDCGADGELELALRTEYSTEYEDNFEKQFIIKNIDGKLQLCYKLDSYYRSNNEIANVYGLITDFDIYDASGYYKTVGYVDKDGIYHFVYNTEESYNAVYNLDGRFDEYINEEDYEELADTYISLYNFIEYGEDNWEEIIENRMYCAEYDDEDYRDITSAANVELLQPVFDKAKVKLYSKEDVEKAVYDKEKEVGLTDEIKNAKEVEWTSFEMDFDDINDIKVITVKNVEELLTAIDSRTTILLEPGEYNVTDYLINQIKKGRLNSYYTYNEYTDELETAKYYGEAQIFYTGLDYDPGLVLRGLQHCTIKSADILDPATIVSNPRSENVITFYSCNGLNIENIVFGHTDGNDECSGDVLYFGESENVTLQDCDLYGCGATGLDVVSSYSFNVNNTVIHDCSVGGLFVSDSYGIYFNNSIFENIDGYGIISVYSGSVYFDECNFKESTSPMLSSWFDGYVTFYACDIADIYMDEIENNESYGDAINVL